MNQLDSVFFTSDTHFDHEKLSKIRGFDTVQDMNEELISRWNKRITRQSLVYHLGDFALSNREHTRAFLGRLNGQIHFILGNHDKEKYLTSRNGCVVTPYYEKKFKDILVNGRDVDIIMCHYPFVTWNRSCYGSINLHGHSHGNLPSSPAMRLDVGVDTNDLNPYSLRDVLERLEVGYQEL